MNALNRLISSLFPDVNLLPAGVYHYQAPSDAERPFRLHLRLEKDGLGTLIVNARTVLHLNQTAAEYAYHLIKQTPEEQVAALVAKRYRVSKAQAKQDYQDLSDRLLELINTPDLDPVSFLNFERHDPYSGELSAPYRLDCALTYRQAEGSEGFAPVDRVKRELTTEEWKAILEKAWTAGIPQVVFTGGEPTLRADLAELITYAETLGQVSGLLSNGLKLIDHSYLKQLLMSGLDHIMILLDMDNDTSWKALENVMNEDIFVTVHITLTKANCSQINPVLDRLASLKIGALSLSIEDRSLASALEDIRRSAAHLGLSLVWDLPVPYSKYNPVDLELVEEHLPSRGVGRAWLYVEPDGDVLPEQGVNEVLGNLLTDPWNKIWMK